MSQSNPSTKELNILAKEFLLHGDQVKAWRKAYPTSKAKLDSQYAKSSKVFTSDKVQLRIKELQEISNNKTEEEFSISASEIKKRLTAVISQGLKQKIDAQGNKISHNLSASVSAMAELNKMDGNHAATDTNLIINPNDVTPWSEVRAGVTNMNREKIDQ